MSVIIATTIKGTNIKKELINKGMIHAGSLYSPRRKQNVDFDYLLDYEKCCPEFAKEYFAHLKEKCTDLNDDEIKEMLFMPVYLKDDDDDTVTYMLNYSYDTSAVTAISRAFPELVIACTQTSEGWFAGSTYMKNDMLCTKTGVTCQSILYGITRKQFKNIDAKTVCISLPVDNTDKYFAKIYVNPDGLRRENLIDEDGDRFAYDIIDKSKTITVYRTLADGKKFKETMTWSELKNRNEVARQNYKKSRH